MKGYTDGEDDVEIDIDHVTKCLTEARENGVRHLPFQAGVAASQDFAKQMVYVADAFLKRNVVSATAGPWCGVAEISKLRVEGLEHWCDGSGPQRPSLRNGGKVTTS